MSSEHEPQFDVSQRAESELLEPEPSEALNPAELLAYVASQWLKNRALLERIGTVHDSPREHFTGNELEQLIRLQHETILTLWEVGRVAQNKDYRVLWPELLRGISHKHDRAFFELRSGILGAVAAARALKEAGLRVFLPEIAEDKQYQVDLWVTNADGTQPRAVQVKASTENVVASVEQHRINASYPLMWIEVPGVQAGADDFEPQDETIHPLNGLPNTRLLGELRNGIVRFLKGEKDERYGRAVAAA